MNPAPGMTGPRAAVTIVTVVKNAREPLARTIASVRALGCGTGRAGVRYVVIDGGSTDGVADLLRESADVVHHWISAPDRGIYDAMNAGWAMAEGHVLFLGAGDEILSLPGADELRAHAILYGRTVIDETPFRSTADFRLKLGNTLHHQSLLIDRALHPEPPFDLSFPVYADFDFNQRLLKAGHAFHFSERLLARAAPHGASGRLGVLETARVVRKNFGPGMALLSLAYLTVQKLRAAASGRGA